jgi:hypothetical protein
MGIMARFLRPSGLTHGRPLFLCVESRRHGTHVTKPHQQPLSAWQANFNPNQPDLSALVKLSSALSDLE